MMAFSVLFGSAEHAKKSWQSFGHGCDGMTSNA
jgi:hypothetical protein